jgi:peptidoglycan/xylan/chitin deacetylase (PgdA/CDA1 family)
MPSTPEAYRAFLEGFLEEGYTFHGFEPLSEKAVVVRHDIDLSATAALEMAELEADLGVETTYCFMLTTPAYSLRNRVDLLERVLSLGHDIALHFDTHHYWDGDPGPTALESAVRIECETLGRLANTAVDTVSFHMPSEWVLGRRYEGFENTYQPRFFGDIDYVSDSRQKWRDRPPFEGPIPEQVQILVHPGLWTPENRGMDAIVRDVRAERLDAIDRYAAAQ